MPLNPLRPQCRHRLAVEQSEGYLVTDSCSPTWAQASLYTRVQLEAQQLALADDSRVSGPPLSLSFLTLRGASAVRVMSQEGSNVPWKLLVTQTVYRVMKRQTPQ